MQNTFVNTTWSRTNPKRALFRRASSKLSTTMEHLGTYGVKLAMVAGGWWVENRGRPPPLPPPPLDTASRGWGVSCAEAPCGQKY